MKQFNVKIQVGTKVQLVNDSEYRVVTELHETRKWIKVAGRVGSFQTGHIAHYSNAASKEEVA
ncbi:MAG: hypothetical protein R8M45_06325 [Ghiorsea sp.]